MGTYQLEIFPSEWFEMCGGTEGKRERGDIYKRNSSTFSSQSEQNYRPTAIHKTYSESVKVNSCFPTSHTDKVMLGWCNEKSIPIL